MKSFGGRTKPTTASYSNNVEQYIMEYQKAIDILKKLLEKHPLNPEEKEAVMTAIGVLSLGSLAKSRIKNIKAKREKSTEW